MQKNVKLHFTHWALVQIIRLKDKPGTFVYTSQRAKHYSIQIKKLSTLRQDLTQREHQGTPINITKSPSISGGINISETYNATRARRQAHINKRDESSKTSLREQKKQNKPKLMPSNIQKS